MNIILDIGTYAGVNAQIKLTQPEVREKGIAFWVRGRGVKLSSDSYASCVGLVLHGDLAGYGAVVHFWDPAGLAEAKEIVDQYMRWLFQQTGGCCGDDVEAVVFGGTALKTETGAKKTKPRIDAIRKYLEERWDMCVAEALVGSIDVSLDLTAKGSILDLVTLGNKKLSGLRHETTLSPMSKTKMSDWDQAKSNTRTRSPSQ